VVYADYENLFGDDTDTIRKNTGTLIDARKEVGLEVNAEKTQHMCLRQNAGKNCDIKMPKRSIDNTMAKVIYFRTTITNQNLIQCEINRRLNSGNACYHSVQSAV
jgi:hypothetical protein